jgi:hypothetical protein
MKYHLVIETKDSLIFELDTDNEPPRVGEWIDLGEFKIVGYFEVKRVVYVFYPAPEPAWVFLRVKKNLKKFKLSSKYPNLKADDI